jgi:hypothetical protein
VAEKETEHEGVSKEGSPAAAREGAAVISAGGGAQGGRLGSNAAAALRCWTGDGERLRRCSATSWTSRRRRWVPAGVCDGGPRQRRTCVVRRRRNAGRQRLGFWESAPGWWRPLIKGRAHPLVCGPRLGGGEGVRGRDSQSPALARRGVRDDKGGPPVSDRGGGGEAGLAGPKVELGCGNRGGSRWPGGKDQGARADFCGWAWSGLGGWIGPRCGSGLVICGLRRN